MLLYDPIVLEDLAGWLNGGVLLPYVRAQEGEGWDSVVVGGDGAGEGMCREGAEAGVELIKPALLQKWCEENSICCLWRNGLRGGVKAKY